MTVMNFPSNPSNGDTFLDYVYDGAKGVWRASPANVASVISSPFAPTTAEPDNLWFDTNDGTLFIRFDDGNSVQWVEAKNAVNYYATSTITQLENRVAALEARATLVEQQPVISGQMGTISSVTGPALVPFDEFWTQRGITYNSTTRRFTVPTAGKYRISFNPFSNTTPYMRMYIGVNTDTPTGNTHRGQTYKTNNATIEVAHNLHSIVQMNANDYVVFYLFSGTIYNNTADRFNQFTIERIGD